MKNLKKWFKGFHASAAKTHLKMSVSRSKSQQTKCQAQIKILEREVAQFLADNREDKAVIKAEQLHQALNLDKAYDLLAIWCELVATRIKFIDKTQNCPQDMVSTISSILYCQGRTEVPELEEVRTQFEYKYGDEWCRIAHENRIGEVHPKLVMCLSVQPPRRWEVTQILIKSAEKHRVDWQPPPESLDQEEGTKFHPPVDVNLAHIPPAAMTVPFTVPMAQPQQAVPPGPAGGVVMGTPYAQPVTQPVQPVQQPIPVAAPVAPIMQPDLEPPVQEPEPAENWSDLFGWLMRDGSAGSDDRVKTDIFLRKAEYIAIFFFKPGELASDRRIPVVQDAIPKLKSFGCEVIGVHTGDNVSTTDFCGFNFCTLLAEEPKRIELWNENRDMVKVGDIIILDKEREVVTPMAGEFLVEDPTLQSFPWREGLPHQGGETPNEGVTADEKDEYDDLLARFENLKT